MNNESKIKERDREIDKIKRNLIEKERDFENFKENIFRPCEDR